MDHAADLGGVPGRVAIAGESAAGNLATTTCLEFRDHGWSMPVHQLLVYPVVDHMFDTQSYREHAEAKPLSRATMVWFWDQYAPDGRMRAEPHASPLGADLRGLPPATIVAAEVDPLTSEGQAYAEKLRAAGVTVDYRLFDGVTHEFFGMGAVVDQARAAVEFAATDLRKALGG